ncbi:MAG: GNAT family N-acetyltransferase [Balneolaceae bacterium]|nr:GNAT family N-acetyltransferase [Balneolaceae bacterium]
MGWEESRVRDNSDRKRFELDLGQKTAYVDYIINAKGVIYLTHTEVPSAWEGQGVASDMVHQVLQEVDRRGLRLVPLCPYVASYLRRHAEWKRLLAEGFNV